MYVGVVASAVPALYGCKTEAELRDQLGAQSLTSLKTRVNARGVLRVENSATKKYVTEVEPTPFEAVDSMTVMQVSLGLSQVSDDVVLPVPAMWLLDAPLVGLAAQRDNGLPIGAFRALLLVRGEHGNCMWPHRRFPPNERAELQRHIYVRAMPLERCSERYRSRGRL